MGLFNKKSDEKAETKEKKSTLTLKDEGTAHTPEKTEGKKETTITIRRATKKYHVREHEILRKPLISEKNFRMSLASPKYVLEVLRDANKLDIKKAFFNIYGLMPKDVNVIRGGGDATRFGRTHGTAKLWKKAIITLKKGEKLDDF